MTTIGTEEDATDARLLAPVRPPSTSFLDGSNVVFFGNSLTADCQRCGAYSSTNTGHKYCIHVTCPLAIKEFKRRRRKRTSTLEQVYIPRKKLGKLP